MSQVIMDKAVVWNGLLREAIERRASDVHFTAGIPPLLRIDGELLYMEGSCLNGDDTQTILTFLLDQRQEEEFQRKGESDFLYVMPGYGQFRGSAFLSRGLVAIALRFLPARIPTLAELGYREILSELSLKQRGLILVAGATGSGKSTTVAAMVDLISKQRACHIITLEDPIEYLYSHQKSMVNQREIGTDTRSFADGLRAALREDPDVIVIGELRDAETIGIALQAALTGHLVLATLHTFDAVQAIERIVNVFSSKQQAQVKIELAMVLQGIVSQQLLRRKGGTGRIAAAEILVATPAVRTLIREGKTCQILSCIQTGGKFGMQTMDAALKELWRRGTVGYEEALYHSYGQENF